MFDKLLKTLKKILLTNVKGEVPTPPPRKRKIAIDEEYGDSAHKAQERLQSAIQNIEGAFKRDPTEFLLPGLKDKPGQDSPNPLKPNLNPYSFSAQQDNAFILEWYTRQSFIGYQQCAIIAQHWLVDRCCTLPAKDAVRDGYFLTRTDGEDLDADVAQTIVELDEKFGINNQLIQFYKKSAIFGIRIALFKVKSKDKKYYEKPFNIDGVLPGAYQGIVQVDPYWITPQLDSSAAADPSSLDYYEPTYWNISGKLYHKSHLVITRYADLPDILKPSYLYGGIPLTQMIYEPVFNYESISNELLTLVESKRLYVIHVDSTVLAKEKLFSQLSGKLTTRKDNYGAFYVGHDDVIEKFDTSLSDLSALVEKAEQRVGAASTIAETILFSKSVSGGLNNKGEGDYRNYNDTVQDARRRMLQLLNRHHKLLIKSYIEPEIGEELKVEAVWNEINTTTEESTIEGNLKQAQTDKMMIEEGIISPEEARVRVSKDKQSGYELEVSNESMPENAKKTDIDDDININVGEIKLQDDDAE